MKIKSPLFIGIILIANLLRLAYSSWNEDRTNTFRNPNDILHNIQTNNRQLLDVNIKPIIPTPVLEFRTPLAPALNINPFNIQQAPIHVPDIANMVWTFETTASHFDPGTNNIDEYEAQISLAVNDEPLPQTLQYSLSKMAFDANQKTPTQYTQTITDNQGNTFIRTRTNQISKQNNSYQSFQQYYQREKQTNATTSTNKPVEPSSELIQSFEETWVMKPGNGIPPSDLSNHRHPGMPPGRDPGSSLKTTDQNSALVSETISLEIDAIKNESTLQRYVTEYSGQVKQGNQQYAFTVKAPHELDGTIQNIDIKIKGNNGAVSQIHWTAKEGQSPNEAITALRQNLPIPLMVGPRSQFRLNGVDVVESPIKITEQGGLPPNQMGRVQDLSKLLDQEANGITVAFSHQKEGNGQPQRKDDKAQGGAFSNTLRNAWYKVTGQWGEVKFLRNQLNQMLSQDPKKFTLSAGFADPSFMSLKELIKTSDSLQPAEMNKQEIPETNKFIVAAKNILKAPFKFVGSVIETTLNLPVIKQTWTATRMVIGVASGVLSGDIFDRSNPIKFDANGPCVITMNGILNSDKDARYIQDFVKSQFGIESSVVIKNNTHFFGLGDVIQIISHEYLGVIDRPVLDTVKAIRIGIQEKGEVYVMAHSQGSAIFKQSLSLLTPEEKSKIHYLGLGPEWMIDQKKEGLASAQNIWNKGDPIPTLGNRLKVFTNLVLPWNWGRTSNTNVQHHAAGVSWTVAHKFYNYEEAVREWIARQKATYLNRKAIGVIND